MFTEITAKGNYGRLKIFGNCTEGNELGGIEHVLARRLLYRVILSVLDPRKCEYLEDYSLDFEHAYMTTYLAS